jgi:hypothetical protein
MNAVQQRSTETPVLNFATATARSRRKPLSLRVTHPDAGLIESCIEYAMEMAGTQIAYEVDPTDSDFAAFFDTKAQGRGEKALQFITECEARTMDGLRAKAAIVETVLQDWNDNLEKLGHDFLVSLARDVIRHQQASIGRKTSRDVIVVPT